MPNDTFKIIELRGTSPKSWEEAAQTAVATAGATLQGLEYAEVTKMDVSIEDGKIKEYRTMIRLSFKILR